MRFAALAACTLGDPARARDLLAPARALAETIDSDLSQGRILRVRGLLAEQATAGDAVGLMQRAIQQFATAGAELDRAYSLTELGAMLRRGGRRTDARGPLSMALDLAHHIGAEALASRAHEELAATGARPRRDARTGLDSLSPSEHRVATLAAQRLSNNQIAQELFVSPKTVEYHLRHVYQKLNITGRRPLRTLLAEHATDHQHPHRAAPAL